MLKMLRRLIGDDIDLFMGPELDLWKVKIDPSQVDQVLADLVVNARDAISRSPQPSPSRPRRTVIDDSGSTMRLIAGQYVLLTVSDTGAGMSPEVREDLRAFLYHQGTGQGDRAWTVHRLTASLNKTTALFMSPANQGKGTTFKIYLPRFESETAEVPSRGLQQGARQVRKPFCWSKTMKRSWPWAR